MIEYKNEDSLKCLFKEWLINKGYKEFTPRGNPSTVYDYLKRLDGVCSWENITLTELYQNITDIRKLYDYNGPKKELGAKSHNAYISALRRFEEFKESKI